MDFHSLARKELQSLCKLNKIPANLTNVAMADALQSLHVVVGIEEYLNASQSETADLVESVETVEVPSPKAPQTRCRTSTRQKAKPTDTETTVTRTTRRGSKQLPKEVEESKNDQLKTPAVSRTTRKAPVTTTCRNVSNQLNECENEQKEEGLVENRYSTRRSTRVTEKKSAAPRGKKGVEKAVKIDSLLDQGNSSAEVEDVCNVFEKLDVEVIEEEVTHESVEEAEDSGEVNSLKKVADEISVSSDDVDLEHNLHISEMKIDQVSDVKPESDGISSPSEEVNNLKEDLEDDLKIDQVCDLKPDSDENLVQKVDSGDDLMSAMKEHNVVVQEEHSECLLESGDDADMEHEDTSCVDSEMVIDNSENPIDELTTKEPEEMSENTVDVISTIDDHFITEEVEDLKPVFFTEGNVTEDSGPTQNPLILSEVMGHPTPFKKATPFKKMTEEVEMSEEVKDKKAEFFTENTDADSGPTQNPSENMFNVVSDDKENKVEEGKIRKKESLNDLSIRQLKKQLKALTLKSLDSSNKEEEAAATGTRPALQALCDNQMMACSETAD